MTDIYYRNGIGYVQNEDDRFDWGPSEVDDGTMLDSVGELADVVVGQRIIKVEQRPQGVTFPDPYGWRETPPDLMLTLEDGRRVMLLGQSDCCAYTDLEAIVEHLPTMDHVITSVQVDGGLERWYLIADLGEVLELQVGWSCGNPFYYGYGFEIEVLS